MYLLSKYGYDNQTSSVIEHNCKEGTSLTITCKLAFIWRASIFNIDKTYRLPPLSYLPSNWSTSISTIAASRYFFILRIILMATNSFCSLSQHSRTWPKVPGDYKTLKKKIHGHTQVILNNKSGKENLDWPSPIFLRILSAITGMTTSENIMEGTDLYLNATKLKVFRICSQTWTWWE